MNPEENNPLTSSTGMSGMGGTNNPAAMPGVGGLSMADSLASAQDNLTSAGLAAPSAQGVMGLDQLGASNPEAVMAPPMEEPLVPAAPVPGSIGSVTSMPASSANPFATADPMTQPSQGGPVPVPEVAPQAPFNPFAPTAAEPAAQNPAASAVPSTAAPAGNAPKAAGLNPAFQPAAPSATKKPKSGKSLNLTTILLGALSAILAIALVIFIVLYINEKNNIKIAYVPTTSEEDSNDTLEILTCSRESNFAYLVGSEYPINGLESFSASYSKDKVQALSAKYSIIFGEGYNINVARDNLVADQANLVSSLGSAFTADYAIDGDELTSTIRSNNGVTLTEDNINAFFHPNGENIGMNSLAEVRTLYEAIGYTCSVE